LLVFIIKFIENILLDVVTGKAEFQPALRLRGFLPC
jgi:hypothetical protein